MSPLPGSIASARYESSECAGPSCVTVHTVSPGPAGMPPVESPLPLPSAAVEPVRAEPVPDEAVLDEPSPDPPPSAAGGFPKQPQSTSATQQGRVSIPRMTPHAPSWRSTKRKTVSPAGFEPTEIAAGERPSGVPLPRVRRPPGLSDGSRRSGNPIEGLDQLRSE